MVSPNVWLSHLSKMAQNKQDMTSTPLRIYAGFTSAAFIFAIIRACTFFYISLRSAEKLHNKMVTNILQAPVCFFDTNPTGRILNRFSKDIGAIDELLPKIFLLASQSLLFVFTAALLPSFTSFWVFFISYSSHFYDFCISGMVLLKDFTGSKETRVNLPQSCLLTLFRDHSWLGHNTN